VDFLGDAFPGDVGIVIVKCVGVVEEEEMEVKLTR
jgi:hypothetical protein